MTTDEVFRLGFGGVVDGIRPGATRTGIIPCVDGADIHLVRLYHPMFDHTDDGQFIANVMDNGETEYVRSSRTFYESDMSEGWESS